MVPLEREVAVGEDVVLIVKHPNFAVLDIKLIVLVFLGPRARVRSPVMLSAHIALIFEFEITDILSVVGSIILLVSEPSIPLVGDDEFASFIL